MSNSCSVEPAYRFNSLASGVLYRIAHFVRNCVLPGSSRVSLHSCHSLLRCHKLRFKGRSILTSFSERGIGYWPCTPFARRPGGLSIPPKRQPSNDPNKDRGGGKESRQSVN